MTKFLPYTRQNIDDADVAAVADVLRSDFLTTGPAVQAFEDALARRVGAAHAIACSSGTSALHLTALALDLGPDDTAIVPALTFVATANGARLTGTQILFADVDPDTGLMRPDDLSDALDRAGPGARAVYPVHIGGQTCDMPAIAGIAGEAGLTVIEDAAHAIGTVDADGAAVGGCGHSSMTVLSFHPAKTVAMGEGGAVTTNDPELARRLHLFCVHGIERDAPRLTCGSGDDPWYYEMQELGLNYRLSDIHCALGLSQLGRIDAFIEKRARLVARYDAALAALAPVARPVNRTATQTTGWHLYQVLIDFEAAGITRGDAMRRLRDAGIGTQVHYIPVHHHPYYRDYCRDHGGIPTLPGADAFYDRCLSLPLFTAMDDGDVDRVAETLGEILG